MFAYKSNSYEKLEKPKKDKKFKENSYEETRKLVEGNESDVVASLGRSHNDVVNKVKNNKLLNLFD